MIQAYAVALNYGFGFIDKSNEPYLTDKVFISIRGYYGKSIFSFDVGVNKIILSGKDLERLHPGKAHPFNEEILHIVKEDGVWKEYFSGTPLKYIQLPSERSYIEISDKDSEAINKAKQAGIREFAILSPITYLTPQEFATRIERYNENDIKQIVSQLSDLQKKARQWAPKYEQQFTEFVNAWNEKTADSIQKLENNVGAYAESKSDNAKEKEYSNTSEQGAIADDFLLGNLNKILKTVGVILVVVFVLAFIISLVFTILAEIPKPVWLLFIFFGCSYILFRKPHADEKDESSESKDDTLST